MTKRIHIVGRKNCGKTTLVTELIAELTSRGFKVGSVKHTHHHHELDTPGKDSYRHREAGAAAVGILSPGMDAVFRPRREERSTSEDRYVVFEAAFADCDIVLVEGDSQTTATKVEVWRQVIVEKPMASEDPTIRAVATDDPLEDDVTVWPRADITQLATHVIELATTNQQICDSK